MRRISLLVLLLFLVAPARVVAQGDGPEVEYTARLTIFGEPPRNDTFMIGFQVNTSADLAG